MRKISIAIVLLSACASRPHAPVAFDHALLFVSAGAPERVVLERAGFVADPHVNRHEGQGTASVTFEFENSYLELIWPDPTVPVTPELQRAFTKFQNRSNWRTTGWSPIGIALHWTGTQTELPFPTWSAAPPWMERGTSMVMLTPRDDATSPSLSVHPESAKRGANHPIGVRRVTSVRIIEPQNYKAIDALTYLARNHVLDVTRGDEWTLELTFDDGRRGESRDFRPDLPLRIRY